METTAALLRRVLNPGSVAFVGASSDTAKFGGRAMRFLLRHGHAGRTAPIDPGAPSVHGIQAYPRIGGAPRMAAPGRVCASVDAREGVAAFETKRKPSFKSPLSDSKPVTINHP